jgi:YesN/AraC family two-component response regulator
MQDEAIQRDGLFAVGDIAAAVGYADLKFFHRLFKKKIGVTPRQYRDAARLDSFE